MMQVNISIRRVMMDRQCFVCPEVTAGTETSARFVGQLKLRATNGTKATFCRKFVAQSSCPEAPVLVVTVLQSINRIFLKFVLTI